ncbi:MAG: amidohydrolase [Gammaproteobacteria bacterium]|nr:amidohydrolase [Gammaproteobacteria bacterium]
MQGTLRFAWISACGLGLVLGSASAQADLRGAIDQGAAAVADQVIAWRRHIHEYPELSNREYKTAELVADHLKSLGLEVETGIAHTGVVGLLRGPEDGPVVALRADMDALPVVEHTGLPYASKVTSTYNGQEVGVMHACGHDTHVAILMGAATVLTDLRDQLPGTVKFIFQPAEEGPPKGENGGARMMVQEGVLKNPDVDAIFGLHISQAGLAGTANYRPKGAMASAQRLEITVKGSQTHGARPWAGVDPIMTGAAIVNALQTIVSRQVDITKAPAVVTLATFHGGVRNNIIPDTAHLTGTIRTYDADMRSDIHRKIRVIAANIAASMGADVEVYIDEGVPVTYNDPELAATMAPTLERVYGKENVTIADRITGAEDFSVYQEQVPGLFFFIGGRPADIPAEKSIPNHSPFFHVDEAAFQPAVRAMVNLAFDYLSQKAG